MRVLHVAEGLASGVLSSLELLSAEQAKSGADVSVLYTRGDDTPPAEQLASEFAASVHRIELRVPPGMPAAVALARGLVAARPEGYDVIHAHSSWAGMVVRATTRDRKRWPHVWYTPHAFGFLKTDTAALTRRAVAAAERRLSRVGSVAAVSDSEAQLARDVARAPRVRTLQNRIRMDRLPRRSSERQAYGRRRVVCLGRVAPQKDPSRFRLIASMLGDVADVCWVGATERDATVFAGSPVMAVPWKSREEALVELANSDVYLSTSRWEGLPLALVEAQAMGLPVVGTDVPGNIDVIRHGVTGFLGSTDEELASSVRSLIESPPLFEQMSSAGQRSACDRFSVGSLGAESLAMYAEALVP